MNAARRAVAWVRWSAAALALTMLFVVGAARAQDVEPAEYGHWSLRAGAYFPSQGVMRDQAGTAWFAFGVDYDPHLNRDVMGGQPHFSVDVFTRSAGGTTVLAVPILANLTWSVTPPESKFRVYAGLGAGAYVVSPLYLDSTVQPGLRVILGADVVDRFFIQLNYDWVNGFTDDGGFGVRADGLSAMVGMRL